MARKLRPDEREAQNRQLPATVKVNLGGKTLATARADLARTPLGAPPVDYDVRSVYDVRPVGAFDFNICEQQAFDTTTGNLTVEMTVPEGLVAVLREIDVWFEPNPSGPLRSDYNWSLVLNGGDVNYNTNVFFGVGINNQKVFLLANENNRIGVRFGASSLDTFANVVGFVQFHGTFQLKSNVPLPFEIANPVGRARFGERPGVPPKREILSLPKAPQTQTAPGPAPAPTVLRTAAQRTPEPPAPMPVKAMAVPPFKVLLSKNLVRGVQTLVPVKPQGGGFILLTDAEKAQYADYIATLKR